VNISHSILQMKDWLLIRKGAVRELINGKGKSFRRGTPKNITWGLAMGGQKNDKKRKGKEKK